MSAQQAPEPLVIALAGQPNCGKSTLFNAVAGFKVDTGNFAGTSVTYAETPVQFEGRPIRLIDLPGTYSISSHDPAEKVARDFLLSGEVDVIINVVDSSILSRSLELTLQLVEMGIPMVLALNMKDEARRKGIEIDEARLAEATGLPVQSIIAVLGSGIDELFRAALALSASPRTPKKPTYDRDVEECLASIARRYPEPLRKELPVDERFVALRLLEMDAEFERRAEAAAPEFAEFVRERRKALAEMHGWPEAGVLGSHRHAVVMDLYEQVATHHSGKTIGLRERIDGVITSPVGGALAVVGALVATFYAAIFLGDTLAGVVDIPFSALGELVESLGPTLPAALLSGLLDGVVSGAGIVLPYLVPMLVLLAVFEDTGLLPRIAFMVDGLLHRVGLHGKSVVPLILGYGCNVPAIMATRNLENPRDRLVTMLVIPFVTCSARSVVIIALAGKYLGALVAFALYALGIAVSLLVSFVVSRSTKHVSLGVIMEVPPLRRPYPSIIAKKVWFRLREFIVVAWPVLLVSSLALSVLSFVGMDGPVNRVLSPLTTTLLGLPEATGIALFLGVFRKELALAMLATALGTEDTAAVLTQGQILAFVIFTMFYIPCIATISALWKERGWKVSLASASLNFGVAIVLATITSYLPLFR